MRKLFTLAGAVAAGGTLLLTAPANAAPVCPEGWACIQLGIATGGPMVRFNTENWQNLDNPSSEKGFTLVNNQRYGDDACAATGPAGTGAVFCVLPHRQATVRDVVVRSVRG